jgi:hypothetical protein
LEIVKRAKLKSKNDKLGMLLELATAQALKNIPLLITRISQFNEFYQLDRAQGPDILFEFGEDKIGGIECKNLNKDFIISQDWFKKAVDHRFFPEKGVDYTGLDAYILVISHFKASPPDLAPKLRKRYNIVEIGFQITNQKTYETAIPILEQNLRIITEWLKNNSKDSN